MIRGYNTSYNKSAIDNNNTFTDYTSRIGNNLYNTFSKKKGKKDIMAFLLTLLIFIGIFFILWIIPLTRRFLINIYNDNLIIKGIIDSIFKG